MGGLFFSDLSGYKPLDMPELVRDRPKPFPVEFLPDVVRDFVNETAKSIPVPIDYAVFSALGVLSSALVGKVIVQARADHGEPTNLYLGLCGESGTAKSAPMGIASAPLRTRLEELNKTVKADNADAARKRRILDEKYKKTADNDRKLDILREIDEIKDRPEYGSIQQDVTPEQLSMVMSRQRGRACVFSDESTLVNTLAGATYSQGGIANIDVFLQGFDGREVSVERKHGGSVKIKRASLSVTLAMQPRILNRLTHTLELEDRGLPERFLFFMPEPLRNPNFLDSPDISTEVRLSWNGLVRELVDLYRDCDEPQKVELTESARTRLYEYRGYLYGEAYGSLGENKGMRSWLLKGHGQVMRLAGILALAESPSGAPCVELRHIESAIALSLSKKPFCDHAKRLQTRQAGDKIACASTCGWPASLS